MVENIDEDVEAEHVTSSLNMNAIITKPNSSLKKNEKKKKKKRARLKEKSATFDYADLKNEMDFPPRINIRRTAICAKSKSADALQLETFIVVSRLKQFDLIWELFGLKTNETWSGNVVAQWLFIYHRSLFMCMFDE